MAFDNEGSLIPGSIPNASVSLNTATRHSEEDRKILNLEQRINDFTNKLEPLEKDFQEKIAQLSLTNPNNDFIDLLNLEMQIWMLKKERSLLRIDYIYQLNKNFSTNNDIAVGIWEDDLLRLFNSNNSLVKVKTEDIIVQREATRDLLNSLEKKIQTALDNLKNKGALEEPHFDISNHVENPVNLDASSTSNSFFSQIYKMTEGWRFSFSQFTQKKASGEDEKGIELGSF